MDIIFHQTHDAPSFSVVSEMHGKSSNLHLHQIGQQHWRCEFPCNQLKDTITQLTIVSHTETTVRFDGQVYPIRNGEFKIPQGTYSLQVGVIKLEIGLQKLDIFLAPAGMNSEEWNELLLETQTLIDALATNSPIGMHHALDHFLGRLERVRELIISIEEVLQAPKSHLKYREQWGGIGELIPNASTPMSFLQTLNPLRILGSQSLLNIDLPENRFLRYATHTAEQTLQYLKVELAKINLFDRFSEGLYEDQPKEQLHSKSDLNEAQDLRLVDCQSLIFDQADLAYFKSNQQQSKVLKETHEHIHLRQRDLQQLHKKLDLLGINAVEEFTPTLALVQEPKYARVYQAFLDLEKDLPHQKTDAIDLKIACPQNNLEAWRLYEGWCGLRILAELRSIPGFDYSDLEYDWMKAFMYLSNYATYPSYRGVSNQVSFTLTHQQDSNLRFRVNLKCQPLEMIENRRRYPDYVLEINHPQGVLSLVFDAKFKQYRSFGSVLGEAAELWSSDEISWLPKALQDAKLNISRDVNGRGYGLKGQRQVFILHPSASLLGYHGSDQRAMARRSYSGGSYYQDGYVHALSESFGFISAAPKRSGDLKVWLRWLLLYHWRIQRPTPTKLPCIHCGELLTAIQDGGPTFYNSSSMEDKGKRKIGKGVAKNYSCQCGVHLSLTRCYQCHYPLFKAGQFWTPPGLNTDYNFDCPRCGDHLPIGSTSLLNRTVKKEKGYKKIRCRRCQGKGYIPHFRDYNGGICYTYFGGCGGKKYILERDPWSDTEIAYLKFANHTTRLDQLTFQQSAKVHKLPSKDGMCMIDTQSLLFDT